MNDTRVTTYSDVDYGESTDGKFTSGSAHFAYSALVSWQSKKQSIVALRTCEAEYIAGSRALQHTYG